MNKLLSAVIIVLLVGIGVFWFVQNRDTELTGDETAIEETDTTATTTADVVDDTKTVIGKSVEGRDIIAYHYGTGEREVIFVGGMHGGYSPNTALVAFDLMDYLARTPSAIPANVKVTVLPVLNPDGLNLVTGTTSRFAKSDISSSQSTRTAGRFNANEVDLNRNFDCDWKESAKWQNKTVSAGSAPFSETESQAFRNYIESHSPSAVVVWYSAAGGVFPSTCDGQPSSESLALTDVFAKASGYKAFADFDFYEITGDMPNWLSTRDIPAISVLLTSHDDAEWTQNKRGIDATLKHVAK